MIFFQIFGCYNWVCYDGHLSLVSVCQQNFINDLKELDHLFTIFIVESFLVFKYSIFMCSLAELVQLSFATLLLLDLWHLMMRNFVVVVLCSHPVPCVSQSCYNATHCSTGPKISHLTHTINHINHATVGEIINKII